MKKPLPDPDAVELADEVEHENTRTSTSGVEKPPRSPDRKPEPHLDLVPNRPGRVV